jgi:hypothetical protein
MKQVFNDIYMIFTGDGEELQALADRLIKP